MDIVHFLGDVRITCSVAEDDADVMPALGEGKCKGIVFAVILEGDFLAIVVHLAILHLQLLTDVGNGEGTVLFSSEPGPFLQLFGEIAIRCDVVDVDLCQIDSVSLIPDR